MRTALALLLALVVLPAAAARGASGDDAARLAAYVRTAGAFNRLFPQEKVYLHFDNTGYFKGETIWYKAYVVRADSLGAAPPSRVLYVELLQGYNVPRAFYANDYGVMPREDDFRRTLFWAPDVTADAGGRAEVSFWNNSTCRSIHVSAEGTAPDGTLLTYRPQ